MYFQWLIEETEAVFKRYSHFNMIELPVRFSKIQHAEHDGELVLENRFYRLNDLGQVRIAHIYAPKINIVVVFFFPEPEFNLPVYGMEFVMLGEKPIVAVMDMSCLLKAMPVSKAVEDLMGTARNRYSALGRNELLPEWFEQCRSGLEFFFRPNAAEDFKYLSQIHICLLKNLTQVFQVTDRYDKENARIHKTKLDEYKRHHRLNSPGLRLMNRSFGPEWTQEYLTNYLFE